MIGRRGFNGNFGMGIRNARWLTLAAMHGISLLSTEGHQACRAVLVKVPWQLPNPLRAGLLLIEVYVMRLAGTVNLGGHGSGC